MRSAPDLPRLAACEVIDASDAEALFDELAGEIDRLQQMIADTEAAAVEAEDRAAAMTTDPAVVDLAVATVGELLRSGRADIRSSIEDPARRAAGDRLLAAHLEAERVRQAVPGARHADHAGGATVATSPSAVPPAVDPPAPPVAAPMGDGLAEGGRAEGRGAEGRGAEGHGAEEGRAGEAPATLGIAGVPAHHEAAFIEFWREQHDIAELRGDRLAPVGALAPMFIMLLLLVVVLRFV